MDKQLSDHRQPCATTMHLAVAGLVLLALAVIAPGQATASQLQAVEQDSPRDKKHTNLSPRAEPLALSKQSDAKRLQASAEGSDSRLSGDGRIEDSGDTDVFHFFAGAGSFSIEVKPAAQYSTRAMQAELYNARGSLIATTSARPGRPAILGGRLKADQYFLRITVADKPAGNHPSDTVYASHERYSIGGIVSHPGALGAPEALAVADYETGEAPRPVTFDGSGINTNRKDIVSWHWDFGDGSTADGPIANHTYSAPGTYTATLTITDERGNTDRDSVVVAVDEHDQNNSAAITDGEPSQTEPAEEDNVQAKLAVNTGAWFP